MSTESDGGGGDDADGGFPSLYLGNGIGCRIAAMETPLLLTSGSARKPEPTLLQIQGIFNLSHYIGIV